jgi:sarcosine oxidase, subunit alpha
VGGGDRQAVLRWPAVGAVVGLAYVHPEDAEPGKSFTVRLENGGIVTPTVTPLPFYDPANARQEL